MKYKKAEFEKEPSAKRYILNDKREIVDDELSRRIDEGIKIIKDFQAAGKQQGVDARQIFRQFEIASQTWNSDNIDLLKTLFSDNDIIDEYKNAGSYLQTTNPIEKPTNEWWCHQQKIATLESVRKRLPRFEQLSKLKSSNTSKRLLLGSQIFLVHGHNKIFELSVARLLERLGIEPVILHEKPDESRTIIEKLEEESENAGYAIVILTADDDGKSKNDTDTKSRARQNVILELGYFVAKLGRKRVCSLYEEGVELPSDFDGVLYTKLDSANAWQTKLAKELKAASFDVDLNKLP